MNTRNFIFLSLAIALVSFSSCKKESTDGFRCVSKGTRSDGMVLSSVEWGPVLELAKSRALEACNAPPQLNGCYIEKCLGMPDWTGKERQVYP